VDGVEDNKLRETWDRLVLLLIARPRNGWELEFKEITRREIERLAAPLPRRSAMSSPRITYTRHPDATPETERSVLAQVYRFVLERRKADEPAPERDGRDDTEGSTNDRTAKGIIPEPS
jgi:hypothetical protein